jgi:pimeloyl-ACP methyl ester carboxylesterase
MHILRTPDIRLHYVDEDPKDAAPVLTFHGEPTWSYLYRHIVPPVAAAGLRVLAPDLRNITLVCQDWGSLIGLRLVAELPERFAQVIFGNGRSPLFAASAMATRSRGVWTRSSFNGFQARRVSRMSRCGVDTFCRRMTAYVSRPWLSMPASLRSCWGKCAPINICVTQGCGD